MYDTSHPYNSLAISPAERSALLGRVLSLVGIAFLCTAGGAILGQFIGPAAFLLSLVGSIGTLIALIVTREKSPANLFLMYGFATFVGMSLGLVLETYLARGLGGAVFNAAGTTAAVTLGAGFYGYTTKRDLSGLGSILFVGLIAVIIASVIGIFVQLPLLQLGIGVVGAVLFTGFIVFDLNRVANARNATEGETIMLAVAIYLDILNLFLMLLRVFGFGGDDE